MFIFPSLSLSQHQLRRYIKTIVKNPIITPPIRGRGGGHMGRHGGGKGKGGKGGRFDGVYIEQPSGGYIEDDSNFCPYVNKACEYACNHEGGTI